MRIADIGRKATELTNRVLDPNYQATERDVAEAAELVSKYIDALERLEDSDEPLVKPVLSADAVADKILSYWYDDER